MTSSGFSRIFPVKFSSLRFGVPNCKKSRFNGFCILTHFFHSKHPIFCEKNHPETEKEEKVTFSFNKNPNPEDHETMVFVRVQNAAAALDQMSLLSYGNSLSAKPLGFRGPFRIHGASLRANPQGSASKAQGADQLFDKKKVRIRRY